MEGLQKLRHGRPSEAVDFDVADAFGRHVGGIDRVERNAVARDDEVQLPGHAVAHHVDSDLRTTLTAQVAGDIAHAHPHGIERINADDAVVGQHADLFGRTARNGVGHDNRIAQQRKLHADAAELAVEARLHPLHLLGTEVGRVGVKLLEHGRNGALDQRSHLHVIDVEPLEQLVDPVELLLLHNGIPLGLGLRRWHKPAQGCKQQQHKATCDRAAHHPFPAFQWMCETSSPKGTELCSPERISLSVTSRRASSSLPTIAT